MAEVFTRRLRELNGEAKAGLGQALKTASEPALVRSAFELPPSNKLRFKMRSTKPSRRNSNPFRDRAGPRQRHRAHRQWTEGGLEHRGLSPSLEKGVGELLKEKDKPEAKADAEAETKARPKQRAMSTVPESLQSVFDRTFAGMSQARETFTPQLRRTRWARSRTSPRASPGSRGLPGVGFEELAEISGRSVWHCIQRG